MFYLPKYKLLEICQIQDRLYVSEWAARATATAGLLYHNVLKYGTSIATADNLDVALERGKVSTAKLV